MPRRPRPTIPITKEPVVPIIESIDVCAAAVPLDKVTSFSNRTVSTRHYGLVKVRSSDGVEGIGFCYVGSAGGAIFEAAVQNLLGPVLLGKDSLAVEGLWQAMYQEALLQGRQGTVMRALSALDIALWDLNAKTVGLPLHKYLGAVELETVPAYASGGYYLDGKTPQHLGEEMASYVDKGFRAVKMKTGRLSPAEEEARLKAAREAIGPDVELMMDCNNAWQDVTQAMQYIRRFEQYDPYFIEEPFGPDDIDSHAKLARLTRLPIATAEIGYGRWYHKELLDKAPQASCRPMPPSAAASPNGSASPPPPPATASWFARTGSMTCMRRWSPRRRMRATSNSSGTIRS